MKYIIIFCLLFFSFTACKNGVNDPAVTDSASVPALSLHPLPDIQVTDSIDMQFYPDATADQKKYTRLGVNDSNVIRLLVNSELMNPATGADCVYDAKLFCFSKGQIVKTLYLAAQSDTCRYIAFIKSGGVTVKTQLSDSTAALINRLRQQSTTP